MTFQGCPARTSLWTCAAWPSAPWRTWRRRATLQRCKAPRGCWRTALGRCAGRPSMPWHGWRRAAVRAPCAWPLKSWPFDWKMSIGRCGWLRPLDWTICCSSWRPFRMRSNPMALTANCKWVRSMMCWIRWSYFLIPCWKCFRTLPKKWSRQPWTFCPWCVKLPSRAPPTASPLCSVSWRMCPCRSSCETRRREWWRCWERDKLWRKQKLEAGCGGFI